MSGVEIGIAVVAAVAALISAYKDGDKIVNKIKKKRVGRGVAPPDDELSRVLRRGEQDITECRDEGITQFGKSMFVDQAAAEALKDITIAIQSSLLQQLAAAEEDDQITDFRESINAAVMARRKALAVLNSLYVRHQEQIDAPPKQPAAMLPSPMLTPKVEEVSKKKRTSWSLFRRSSVPLNEISPPSIPDFQDTQQLSPRYSAQPSSPILNSRSPTIQSQQQFSVRSPTISAISRTSTLATLSPTIHPSPSTTITESNKFAGFCKGAYFCQTSQWQSGMERSDRGMERTYGCRTCSFKVPAKRHPDGTFKFDRTVYTSGSIAFTLWFLFKSHAAIKSQNKMMMYRCCFCVFSGERSVLYQGEAHFLEHVVQHRTGYVGLVPLVGPISVSAETATPAPEDDFDVRFPEVEDEPVEIFTLPASHFELEAPSNLFDVHEMPENSERSAMRGTGLNTHTFDT